MRFFLLLVGTLGLWSFLAATRATADETVALFVVREHGVGSAAQAQPYLDRFIDMAAKLNDWKSAKGTYFTTRATAEAQIESTKPHFAILSLGAFLGMREKYHLEVVGRVDVWRAGGRQFHLLSKAAKSAKECFGKKLSSDHVDDPRYIERVVARGDFKLADFEVVQATRPLQPIKQVVNGEADCALVDDAQKAEVEHLEGGKDLKTVWSSKELPPMVVAMFPGVSASERKRFTDGMGKICDGEGKTPCAEVGILALQPATEKDYAAVVTLYGK